MSVEKIVTGTLAERDAKINANFEALDTGKLSKTETAAAAAKLTTSAGSTTQPVYFDGGVPKACTYELNKTVPANAVFTDTVYTLPTASASVLGGVKTGSNITNSSGTISITKANVVAALGYTPPTSATTVTKTEFTASSANWGTLLNGYYPFTLAASGKHFLGMYRTNGSTYESVMVDVVESGSNIIIQSTEKFAGFVLTI